MPRLALGDTLETLRRQGLWLLLAAVTGYGLLAAVVETEPTARGSAVHAGARLGAATGLQVLWLLALGLPLVVGGHHAQKRVSGYDRLLRARSLSPCAIICARLLAAGVVASASAGGVVALVAVGAALIWPQSSRVGNAIGFAAGLLDVAPLAWTLAVTSIFALASAATLVAAVGLGQILSPLTASVAPALAVLMLGFALTGRLWWANPLERLSFLQIHGAQWNTPASMLLYWLTVLGVLVGAAALAACGRRG